MKTMMLTVSFLSLLVIAMPVLAVDEHHPEGETKQVAAQADTGKTAAVVQQMEEMRNKIDAEKDPKARKELLGKHMQMMRDGMMMMSMMGGGGMMMEQKDTGAMPMADRMSMMEKKMMMMEKMMNQGGGMMGGGMMGGMMGGASSAPMDDRMNMMESKMMMMQEMMNGMLLQQEKMMK